MLHLARLQAKRLGLLLPPAPPPVTSDEDVPTVGHYLSLKRANRRKNDRGEIE